jgi:hypothetical protein
MRCFCFLAEDIVVQGVWVGKEKLREGFKLLEDKQTSSMILHLGIQVAGFFNFFLMRLASLPLSEAHERS